MLGPCSRNPQPLLMSYGGSVPSMRCLRHVGRITSV